MAERISEEQQSESAIVGDRVIRTNAGTMREFSYEPSKAGRGRGKRGRGRGGRR